MKRYLALAIISFYFALIFGSIAQEGIWEDSLPLDPIGVVDAGSITGTDPGTDLTADLEEEQQIGDVDVASSVTSDDSVLIGSSPTAAAWIKLPTGGTDGCSGTNDKSLYKASTNAFSCGTDQNSNSFGVIDPPTGDTLTALSPGDTLNIGASGGITVSGNSAYQLLTFLFDVNSTRFGTQSTFTDLDATPDVSNYNLWITNTSDVTITGFDNGGAGQMLFIESNGNITYDCTGASLDCGSTDLVTEDGDITIWHRMNSGWHLAGFFDASEDANLKIADYLPLAGWGSKTTFAAADTSPDVCGGGLRFATTASDTVTIDKFDCAAGVVDGFRWQVQSQGEVTYDCVTSSLICGAFDLETYKGDVTIWEFDGAFGLARIVGFVPGIYSPAITIAPDFILKEHTTGVTPDPGPGFGVLWIDSGYSPQRLMFTDDDDNHHVLAYTSNYRECQQSITTEQAGDILMCAKAQATVTLVELDCTALGSTTPVAEIVEVVECDSQGANCVGSGFTIQADLLENNYPDSSGTDWTIDTLDWWGLKLTSFTTQADFLHCQIAFTEHE